MAYIKNKYSFKSLHKYTNFSHEFYLDLKKELRVQWCCHLSTNLLVSFSNMACDFIMVVGLNKWVVHNLANNWGSEVCIQVHQRVPPLITLDLFSIMGFQSIMGHCHIPPTNVSIIIVSIYFPLIVERKRQPSQAFHTFNSRMYQGL